MFKQPPNRFQQATTVLKAISSATTGLADITVHSSATPPQNRRRLFSPKNLRSPFGQRRPATSSSGYTETNSTLSGKLVQILPTSIVGTLKMIFNIVLNTLHLYIHDDYTQILAVSLRLVFLFKCACHSYINHLPPHDHLHPRATHKRYGLVNGDICSFRHAFNHDDPTDNVRLFVRIIGRNESYFACQTLGHRSND